MELWAEVFIQVIGSVSDGCRSIRLYFRSVIFRMRVATGHTRVGTISHGSVERSVIRTIKLVSGRRRSKFVSSSIGLGLSSVNNWFGFTRYRSSSGIFQVEFGYELRITNYY